MDRSVLLARGVVAAPRCDRGVSFAPLTILFFCPPVILISATAAFILSPRVVPVASRNWTLYEEVVVTESCTPARRLLCAESGMK